MSVLNQSGDEPVECPLCMEQLEVDDLNFYPCTCGYQICRFCWHRIRTDENGLCPACRKSYPENPADFRPLTTAEVQRLKSEKRLKEQQRKQKVTESRQHLASVRVVQRNLVFVVGLPMRLADSEVLKKHEYFGKFGKIHKVVINQSTSYAGSQGPSASAYVTYQRAEDSLRAIAAVNNIAIDGRTLKASLGTTKYCSHFMKNQVCPKTECMYLHDLGDPEASFTKEDMQQGKHQEYEKKLHEQLVNNTSGQQLKENNNNNNREVWPALLQGGAVSREEEEGENTAPASAPPTKVARQNKSESSSSASIVNGIVNGVVSGNSCGGQTPHKKRHNSGDEATRGRRRGRDKSQQQHTTNGKSQQPVVQQSQSQSQQCGSNGGAVVINGQKRQRNSAGNNCAVTRNGTGTTTTTTTRSAPTGNEENDRGNMQETSPSPPQSSSPSSSSSSLCGSSSMLTSATSVAPSPSVVPNRSSRSPLSTSDESCSSASSISEENQVLSAPAAPPCTQDALSGNDSRDSILSLGNRNNNGRNNMYPSSSLNNLVETSHQWATPPSSTATTMPPSNMHGCGEEDNVQAQNLATGNMPLNHSQPLPQNSTDWHAALSINSNHKLLSGLQNNRHSVSSKTNSHVDDELDFDPFAVTQKALAELIESEEQQQYKILQPSQHRVKRDMTDNRAPVPHSDVLERSQSPQPHPPPPPLPCLNYGVYQQHMVHMSHQSPHPLLQQQCRPDLQPHQHFTIPPPPMQVFRCNTDPVNLAPATHNGSRLMEVFSSPVLHPPTPIAQHNRPPPPPGFSNPTPPSNPLNPFNLVPNNPGKQQVSVQQQVPVSNILSIVNLNQQQQQQQQQQSINQHNGVPAANMLHQMRLHGMGLKDNSKEVNPFSLVDWHAILPNLGCASTPSFPLTNGSLGQPHHAVPRAPHKDWQNDWTAMDPAIVAATPLISVVPNMDGTSTSNTAMFPWVKTLEPLSSQMYPGSNSSNSSSSNNSSSGSPHVSNNLMTGWPGIRSSSSSPLSATAAPPPGFSHPLRAAQVAQSPLERPTIEISDL